MPGKLLELFGRFHLLVLHLPIGMMVALGALEAWMMKTTTLDLAPVRRRLALLTFGSAVLAVACGWALARDGGYDGELLFRHRWLSVAFAVTVGVLAWISHLPGRNFQVRVLVVLSFVIMTVGAHYGGAMTHGKNFLTKGLGPKKVATMNTPLLQESGDDGEDDMDEGSGDDEGSGTDEEPEAPKAPTFARDLKPIFDNSCVKCHGPEKQKGAFRLDTLEWLLKGGENGSVAVSGKPQQSSLYTLTVLDPDDVDIMPSKGDPLTREQTEVIRRWILLSPELKPGARPDSKLDVKPPQRPTDLDALAKGVAVPNAEAMELLTKAGVSIRPVSANKALIDIDFGGLEDPVAKEHAEALATLAPNTAWLDLSRKKLGVLDLSVIASMTRLRRLHLEHTGVTDADVAKLGPCRELRYLNLTGTKVGDAALKTVAALPALESVYLWQTAVSDEGLAGLKNARPGLKIVSGTKRSR